MEGKQTIERKRPTVRAWTSYRQVRAQLRVSRITASGHRRQAIQRTTQDHEYETRLPAVGRARERDPRAQQSPARGQCSDRQEFTPLHSLSEKTRPRRGNSVSRLISS